MHLLWEASGAGMWAPAQPASPLSIALCGIPSAVRRATACNRTMKLEGFSAR
jgi:hypothetical protein